MVIKKKKKIKKVVKHPAPDPAEMGLGQGPPGSPSSAQPFAAVASARLDKQELEAHEARQGGDHAVEEEAVTRPSYYLHDGEEFRNVWDGGQ